MSEYRELLLGCGHDRNKRVMAPSYMDLSWKDLTTADINPNVGAVWEIDLNATPWQIRNLFTAPHTRGLNANSYVQAFEFDEVHAYEVLEHLGQQGDAVAFFKLFSEIWRVLKPDGYCCATVPSRFSPWLWGDPSHRRAILPESLVFLDQSEYVRQLDGLKKTSMSDFRGIYHADFKCVDRLDNRETFHFVLQAVKPSRWVEPTR